MMIQEGLYAQQVIQLYPGLPIGSEHWTWSEQTSTNNMYNSIRGIAGNTILSIKALELPDSSEEANNS